MKKKSGTESTTAETPPAKPKKKKEATKSREWERERRERLNNSFNDLSKILPTNDNKAITKKMEILQKATTFIKALQEENAELLESGGLEKSWSREVKQLKCQVKELTSRNQQLVTLLQEAGGKLPTWVSLPPNQPVPPPLGKRQFLYSNKLSQEDAEKTLEKLTEPKPKKSRKTSPQKEKSSNTSVTSKKKKSSSKTSAKKDESSSSSVDSLNPIKPPSVAQLLNVPSSTNNISKNDNIPSTSGLVLLPSDKPASMDLSPGILLLKSSTQSNPVTPVNNSLSSGGLLIMRPPNLQSQQSSALAPGTCILLPPSNNNMLQNSLVTPSTSQLAQTTTILTTPIMATGQSNSLVQSTQTLTTTSNTVTPTYVLTNGNLVSVLPTSSNSPSQKNNKLSKSSLAIVPKVTKENKNANKVPIPKLPKRIIKGNKTTTKKNTSAKAKLKVSKTSNLEPLKSIVTSIASTEKAESVSKASPVVSTEEVKTPEVDVQSKDKEVEEVKDNDKTTLQPTEQPETPVKLPLAVSSTVETTNKSSSHKTSYSIDSLCKGKNGSTSKPLSEPLPDVIVEASQITVPNTANKENTKEILSDDKNTEANENIKENSKKDEEKTNSSKTTEVPVLQSSKLNEITKKDVKRKEVCIEKSQNKNQETLKDNKSTGTSEATSLNPIPPVTSQSDSHLPFTEPVQSTAPFNTFDHCNEIRNQEFPPAQISPSGFIGPQPPMATVVSAPLSKDGIDQYTQSSAFRNSHEETCREQENISISENIENQQQNDVLSSGMPSSFSSDIFASLNVPSGHPESISPTAAFLLAFPLVSSTGRTNEMIPEQTDIHRNESCNNTSNSLLQLGSIDENQPSGHTVEEMNHLSSHTINRHVVDESHNTSHILQNNHNIINQNNQYNNKQQTKVLPPISTVSSNNNTFSFSSSIKQSEVNHNMKQFNSHNLLPPMPHTFPMNEHLSDYDAEITSIMSTTNTTTQEHDSNQNHNPKIQRNISTTNNNNNNSSSSCSAKVNEKCRNTTQLFVTPQQQTSTASNGNNKQFIPLSNQNCHQSLPETQQHVSNDQIQQPMYRPCNTSKNKLQSQHNPYQNNTTSHFSTSQQNDRNARCNPSSYHQPAIRTGAANITSQPHLKMPPPRLATLPTEICSQKNNSHEQTDTSYYIGKLNTNATSETKLNTINSQQRYKTSTVESIPTQTTSNVKTPTINNRFDRNLTTENTETSRHNLIPTSTTQPYSYSLFNNEYQTSSYLPLSSNLPTHLVTSASTTNAITTEAPNTSLASITKPHTASNFGILSWSTLSPMSAPNTQQFPGYINNNNETNCQKQTTTSYQNSINNPYNENQNKITSYQQSNNRTQISYPPQINKEVPPVPRPPVNWMTTPDIRNENVATHNSFDHTLAPCTTNSNIIQKDTNTSCNSFISNTTYSECAENLGHPWQGSKVANIQHQNPSNPLPTLVGDLALGPTPPSSKYCGYKATTARKQDKDGNKRNEYNPAGSSGSFLSVSQLVDHNIKEPISRGGSSSRRTTRPSSKGGSRRDRNKNQNTQQTLHFNEPPPVAVATTYPTVSNWPAPKPSYKTAPSNYSAEALIGLPVPPQQDFLPPSLHTPVDKVNTLDRYSQNYSSRSHFPTDTTNTYFPESIDTNYQQTTYNSNCTPSNYQSSTNNYMSNTGQSYHGPDITGSSITGTSFTSELASSNFLFPSTTTSSMGTSRTGFFPSEITPSTNTNPVKNSTRNNKRRNNNDQTENYQDNPYNSTTNQHNHQEYGNSARSHPTPQQPMVPRCNEPSAQNCAPTYHSSRGTTVQPSTLPSHSTTVAAAGGSSLTNFNLSTIFPEMNDKVPVPPLPAFVSSKNLGAGAPLLGSSSTDYVLHHPNMSFNNLLAPPSHQVGIGLNQSFPTPSFSNMMPPSLAFSVHEH